MSGGDVGRGDVGGEGVVDDIPCNSPHAWTDLIEGAHRIRPDPEDS